MTTREDLLETIAAAQAQLAGLDVVPEEDPGGDAERYFRLVARHGTGSHHYTYLLLRLPSADWYVTGNVGRGELADRNGRMSWRSVRSQSSSRSSRGTSWSSKTRPPSPKRPSSSTRSTWPATCSRVPATRV